MKSVGNPTLSPAPCLRLLGAGFLSILFSHCSWSRDDDLQSQFNRRDEIKISYEQLRLRMRSLVDPMGGQVENSADRIIATNSDPEIQRAALEWKAQSVPAFRESLFQPNPMTALFDTWVLLFQMENFYTSGDGARTMKSAAPIAAATIREMEREYHQIVRGFTVTGDVSEARAFGRKWASDHPVEGSLAFRESTLTRAGEIDPPGSLSASDAIADITYTVDDLNRRLEIYSDQAVRQARWEAELLTMDLNRQLGLDQAMPLAGKAVNQVAALSTSVEDVADSVAMLSGTVGQIVPVVDRLTKVAETTPALIVAERTAAIEAAQLEITRAIETVEKERGIALNYVTDERVAALSSLQEAITAEREILTRDLETISTRVVDHTFTRVVQLVVGILLALVVILLTGLFLVRRMIAGLIEQKARAA